MWPTGNFIKRALHNYVNWRCFVAFVTAIYFAVIPLPDSLARLRRDVGYLGTGIILLYCQIAPVVMEAWAVLSAIPSDVYSALREAILNLGSISHVWLAAIILYHAALPFLIGHLGRTRSDSTKTDLTVCRVDFHVCLYYKLNPQL